VTDEVRLTFAETADEGFLSVAVEELVRTRLAIQANSGFGKSRALRQLYEQTFGRLQQFIFDVEGEFGSLREKFDYLLIGDTSEGADLAIHPEQAAELCRRLMEIGASCIFDLSALPSRTEQQRFVRLFLEELMRLPRSFWRQILVGIDEAQVFVPEKGYGDSEATEAIISVAARGRKRGYCLVLAFQRLSQVHKGALAELTNRMIGRTGLDTDLRRAAKDLGMDTAGSAVLKRLERGQFYAFGPAFGDEVTLVRSGDVLTSHFSGVDGGQYVPPVASEAVRALLSQLREVVALDPVAAPSSPVPTVQIREVPVFVPGEVEQIRASVELLSLSLRESAGDMARISGCLTGLQASLDRLPGANSEPSAALPSLPVPVAAPAVPIPTPPRRVEADPVAKYEVEPNGKLSAPQQAILNALADFAQLGHAHMSRSNVAVWSAASPTSSAYGNNLGRLRTMGLIDYPSGGQVALTDAGRQRVRNVVRIVSAQDLLEAWCKRLSGPQSLILRRLVQVYPNAIARETLASVTGASATSSAYGNNLGHLRSLGLIDYPRPGQVAATRLLFPTGQAI
jgi:hypothetical protein